MKLFHISDVLSVTTGRLVSTRHMDGVYDVLNFLTSDNLYTHQLPRARDECWPCLRYQFPKLMADAPEMLERIAELDRRVKASTDASGRNLAICAWVEEIREAFGLPNMLPVYELGAAMVGDEKVIVLENNGYPEA